ncbi:hypothetical protein MPDQ_001625 [Monascus purpureus]|uniref:FAD-binding domain-containing protein n=1 Tax=Monascus purpureus TaxID=5098 RepID=A0A507QRJ6_MONPU|nr:hypothetical protein MPDQ_001625 [Monascus purpureus]
MISANPEYPMPPRRILIVGAGIAGISCALALSRELTPFVPDLQITVFERHDILSTSGGAINLTPVAQRHLSQLRVLEELDKMGTEAGVDVDAIEMFSSRTGRQIGAVDFTDSHGNGFGGFKGRRVMRIVLSVAMLAVVERTKNINMVFGKKLVGGDETEDEVTLRFDDGTTATGDLVVGCDGVHSATRSKIVDPGRTSEYTGISFLQTTIRADQITAPIHFRTTAMNISRHGSLLTSYCDRECEQIFVAAIVQFDEPAVLQHRIEPGQDWKTQYRIKTALQQEARRRFGRAGIPCIRELMTKGEDWMLYPVYQMPPRDESAAYALDDAILFSRIMARYRFEPLPEVFKTYEGFRRDTVDRAFKISRRMWERNRDMGLLEGRLKEWIMPLFLRNHRYERETAWVFDAAQASIPTPSSSEEEFSL